MRRLWRQKRDTPLRLVTAATIPPVRFAVVSDLHLGLLSEIDVARHPGRPRAAAGRGGRRRPRGAARRRARDARAPRWPTLLELVAAVLRGARRGDHRAAGDRRAGKPRPRASRRPGSTACAWTDAELGSRAGVGGASPVTARSAGSRRSCRGTDWSRVAYPGLRLRPDVYATHGHYLDLPLTVPRIESVAASAMARVTGRGRDRRSARRLRGRPRPAVRPPRRDLAEAAVGRHRCGGAASLAQRLAAGQRARRLAGLLLVARARYPAPWQPSTGSGVGPLEPGISGEDLRRGGLAAMREVAGGAGARRVPLIFGHTHRPGPLPGDDESDWTHRGGHPAVEQRQLVPRAGVRRAARPPGALLAGHGDHARGYRPAAHRERARGRGAARPGRLISRRATVRRLPAAAAAGAISAGAAPLPASSAAAAASASARSSSASPFGGSLAHSSSNSTRHLPGSACSSLSLARKVRPARLRKPVTGLLGAAHARVLAALARGPQALDQLLGDGDGRFLPAFFFQMTKPQPGSSRDQHEIALAVLGDLAAADRARTELGALDLHALQLVQLLHRLGGERGDVLHEGRTGVLALLDQPQAPLPVAGELRRGELVLAEQAHHLDRLLGRDQRAALALEVARP